MPFDEIDKNTDDYYTVNLPESEWTNINRWFGTNVSMTSMVLTEWNKIQKTLEKGPRKSIKLGVSSLDVMTGGLCPGEVMYIGNVDEKTNTTFSLNIVNGFGINNKKRLLIFNSGKGEYSYARKLISLRADVDEFNLKVCELLSPDEIERIENAITDIQSSDISVVNTLFISVESIYDEIHKLDETNKPELILIDNLRCITTRRKCKNKMQEYRVVSNKLWKLAKDTRIPIVITGPISKKRRSMKDYWPTALDMPAENMIDSFDKILMVHRDENAELLNISSIKNNDGDYGYRKIKHLPDTNRLEEIINQKAVS